MKHSAVLLLALLAATVNGLCSIDTTPSANLGSATVVSGEYLGQSFRVPSMVSASGTLDKIFLTLGSFTGTVSVTIDIHPIPMAGSGIYATGTAVFCNGCANTIVFSPPMPIKGCQDYAFVITTSSIVPVPFKYVSNIYTNGQPYYGTTFPPTPFMASNDLSFTLYFSNCLGTTCPAIICTSNCGYGDGTSFIGTWPTLWDPHYYLGVVITAPNFDLTINTYGWLKDVFLYLQYSGTVSFTISVYNYPLPTNENTFLYRATVTSTGFPTGIYHLINSCLMTDPCTDYAIVFKDLSSANPVHFYTDDPLVDNIARQTRLEGTSWPPAPVAGDLIWATSWLGCTDPLDPTRC